MLHKAYVEEVIDKYQYKVRIPVLHKIKDAPGCTPTDELPVATLAVTPGNIPHLLVGSVVYIDFESEDNSLPVILGTLLTPENENKLEPKSSSDIVNLEVDNVCSLPKDTSIGNITSYQLGCLQKLDRPIDDYVRYAIFYTQIKQQLIDLMYPIGSIIHRYDEIDPSTILGGKWERLNDHFLIDYASGGVGYTGGRSSITINGNNLPDHIHNLDINTPDIDYAVSTSRPNEVPVTQLTNGVKRYNYDQVSPISIVNPYQIVRIYRRIA